MYWDYHKEKRENSSLAADKFIKNYREQCENFVKSVLETAKEHNKTVFEVLPFQEEDNLLTWEKGGHTTYRAIAAESLRELGYDVEEY